MKGVIVRILVNYLLAVIFVQEATSQLLPCPDHVQRTGFSSTPILHQFPFFNPGNYPAFYKPQEIPQIPAVEPEQVDPGLGALSQLGVRCLNTLLNILNPNNQPTDSIQDFNTDFDELKKISLNCIDTFLRVLKPEVILKGIEQANAKDFKIPNPQTPNILPPNDAVEKVAPNNEPGVIPNDEVVTNGVTKPNPETPITLGDAEEKIVPNGTPVQIPITVGDGVKSLIDPNAAKNDPKGDVELLPLNKDEIAEQ